MLGRPRLYSSYESESSLLPTTYQKVALAIFLVVFALMPFNVPIVRDIPFFSYLRQAEPLGLLTEAMVFAIAALGLNLLSGVAGQVSLGHAFFMGVGAYTAVILGGENSEKLVGLGLPMWIWLPGAGVGAALAGIIVSPAAVRVRGLYLGIVTVGLVFIGLHLSKMLPQVSGGPEIGREFPPLQLRLWKEETPLIDFEESGKWLWFDASSAIKKYFLIAILLGVVVVLTKNLIRSRTGRAWQAIRDRDVAAEVMGIPEAHYKLIAFAISSFFAGIAGALFASLVGTMNPEKFDLILSVEFIAILLIGGAGTTSGMLMGTFFVVMSPLFFDQITRWMGTQAQGDGFASGFFDAIVSTGLNPSTGDTDNFGIISTATIANGFPLPAEKLDGLIYGVLVIVFLLFEPLGLFGIWVKIRNYWKTWPFSY